MRTSAEATDKRSTFFSSADVSAASENQHGGIIQLEPANRLSLKLDFSADRIETATSHPHIQFFPLNYEQNYAYPLLVWLHGTGGDERQVMRIMPQLSMRNYVAVAPQGFVRTTPGGHKQFCRTGIPPENSLDVHTIISGAMRPKIQYDWFDDETGITEAEERIFDCISLAKKRNNIADKRIFIAGFGSGGTAAMRLGLLYPECFAGIVSLCGRFPSGSGTINRWAAARNTAVYLGIPQQNDGLQRDACRGLELLHTAGIPATIREYPCGQELVPQMFQDINRWMMGLVCGG
ncbi:hypothetical protein FACS189427_10570 [Planctomycetales bacterium]|nr:hypothetical protein FACS189427_10570 [Planctomycetales bacterium]